ncbi:DUF2922 domain-containing protein [Sinobaca sp. H24]|uniref:DUF2922 domain-containing protein n=1 Tax=Sinobaca sp. H24 TaxID=2923376 RepID=UPI002079C419|nr:DUF2922 domain-containing protein [Sinobaca sp. H24]
MNKRLELRFENEEGKLVTITLEQPIEPADPIAVEAAMDAVIASAAFTSSGGLFVGKRDARIVDRSVDVIFEA